MLIFTLNCKQKHHFNLDHNKWLFTHFQLKFCLNVYNTKWMFTFMHADCFGVFTRARVTKMFSSNNGILRQNIVEQTKTGTKTNCRMKWGSCRQVSHWILPYRRKFFLLLRKNFSIDPFQLNTLSSSDTLHLKCEVAYDVQ